MQASETRLSTPPDDVLVTLFDFAIAAAQRFWPRQIRSLDVGVGTPATLRPIAPTVRARLNLRASPLTGAEIPDSGTLLLGMILETPGEERGKSSAEEQWRARAWMVFSPTRRQTRHALLEASRTSGRDGNGWRVRVVPERDGSSDADVVRADHEWDRPLRVGMAFPRAREIRGWKADDDLLPILFYGKATFLCRTPEDLLCVHPVAAAILLLYHKKEDLYLGRWDRQRARLTERRIATKEFLKTQIVHARAGYNYSFSASGRYVSWLDGPSNRKDEMRFRRVLDLSKPLKESITTSVRAPLGSDNGLIMDAVWLGDEAWIDIVQSRSFFTDKERKSAFAGDWKVYTLRDPTKPTPLTPSVPAGSPDADLLWPIAYNEKTSEIACAVERHPYLAFVHRGTGATRFLEQRLEREAISAPRDKAEEEKLLSEGGIGVSPDGQRVKRHFIRYGSVMSKESPDARRDMFFVHSVLEGRLPPSGVVGGPRPIMLRPFVEFYQVDFDVTHQPHIASRSDVNGDVLLWFGTSVWRCRKTGAK